MGNLRICSKCIMDTTDPDITFDEKGVCNYCRGFPLLKKKHIIDGKEGEAKLSSIIKEIKGKGKGKEYDCLIGLSGGVDSTYVAYLVKKWGLKPLAIHLDNGWDSELSVSNIQRIVEKLNIDLYTYVLDWEEFKDLQLAYFKASVVNLEVPTDHAIPASLYNTASKMGIKYIIIGGNTSSESLMPKKWTSNANDLANLKDIHKRYGKLELKNYPTLGLFKILYYWYIKKLKPIPVLNYMDYKKFKAKGLIMKELGWKDYGVKHGESTFTKFYQAYILPKKFNIDKRKAHLSNLIQSGQITREEALNEVKKDVYTKEELEKEKRYVLKKFDITETEFQRLMNLPNRDHSEFKSEQRILEFFKVIRSIFGNR